MNIAINFGAEAPARALMEHLRTVGYSGPLLMDEAKYVRLDTVKRLYNYQSCEPYTENDSRLFHNSPDPMLVIDLDCFIRLKLNDEHTAAISKDVVRVGCQAFSPSVLLTLADKIREAQGHE